MKVNEVNSNTIRFGPSGNSPLFYDQGYKSSIDMPKWLVDFGLNSYEYNCTKGVKIKEKSARVLGKNATANKISLSIHAPYYINMATQEKDKQQKSKKYLLDSIQAAHWMGASRVVFHPGSCRTIPRKTAVDTAKKLIMEVVDETKGILDKGIFICPETMGKKNQLGTLEEVLEFCSMDERIMPTIDFGHIHALGRGAINSKDDYVHILDNINNCIGEYRYKNVHCHFSHIEYSDKGERRHRTFADEGFGPDFTPLAELIVERELTPVIICESRGTMARDALEMKHVYNDLKDK